VLLGYNIYGGTNMTTILEIDATAWKQDVYSKLSDEDVKKLNQAIKEAIAGAGFVTGSLYLLPKPKEGKMSSDPVPVHPCFSNI